jgi:leader peptidase (prepilin peptidase)/N-methyltransferase
MGHGDFKLLAAIGAWVGWQQLLPVILISSLTGTLVGIVLLIDAKRQHKEMTSIPFGPYLAAGGWITLVWGQELSHWYLSTL